MRQAWLYAVIPLVLASNSAPTKTWIVLPAAIDVQGQTAHLLSPSGLDNSNGGILGHAFTKAFSYNKLNFGCGLKEYSSRNKKTFSFSSPMLVHQTYAKLSNELRYYAGSRAHARPPKGASPGWGVPKTWMHKARNDTAGLFVLPILYFAFSLWRWLLTFWCFTIDQPRAFSYTSPMSASPASPMSTTPLDAAVLLRKRNARRAMKSAASRKRKMRYAKLLCLGWVVLFSLPEVSATTGMAVLSSSSLDNSSINHEEILKGVRGSSDDTLYNHTPSVPLITAYPRTVIEDPEPPVFSDSNPHTSTESTSAVEVPKDSRSERSHESIVDSSTKPRAVNKKRKHPESSNPPAAKKQKRQESKGYGKQAELVRELLEKNGALPHSGCHDGHVCSSSFKSTEGDAGCFEAKVLGCGPPAEKKRKRPECSHVDCTVRPSFGFEGGKAERCKRHIIGGMIDVTNSKRCSYPDCPLRPSFGVEGGKAERCKEHIKEGMINVKSKRCSYANCPVQPSFGVEGGDAERCKKHIKEGMVNVNSKRCSYTNCPVIPCYGFEGGEAERCKKHIKEGMVNVVSKRCSYADCPVQPSFGFEGGQAERCKEHIKEGMVDVVSKRCSYADCPVQPSFGFEGEEAERCKEHIKEGMVDVKHKRCSYADCPVIPCYGFEGGEAERCNEHIVEGMINVRSKRCSYADCNFIPCYGLEWGKAERCAKHPLEGMINVVSKRCSYADCNFIPCYGLEWGNAERCEEHRMEGMANVVSKRCIEPGCDKCVSRITYGGFCMTCFSVHFPNEPTKVNLWQKAMLEKVIEWKENGSIADGGMELTIRCYDPSYGKTRSFRLDAWIRTSDDITVGFEADGPTHFFPVLHYTSDPEEASEKFVGYYQRDRIKEDYCRENGIYLFRISELDVKHPRNMGEWMERGLKSLGQTSSDVVTMSHRERYTEATNLFDMITMTTN